MSLCILTSCNLTSSFEKLMWSTDFLTSCNDHINQPEVKGEILAFCNVKDRPFLEEIIINSSLRNLDQVTVIIDDKVTRYLRWVTIGNSSRECWVSAVLSYCGNLLQISELRSESLREYRWNFPWLSPLHSISLDIVNTMASGYQNLSFISILTHWYIKHAQFRSRTWKLRFTHSILATSHWKNIPTLQRVLIDSWLPLPLDNKALQFTGFWSTL